MQRVLGVYGTNTSYPGDRWPEESTIEKKHGVFFGMRGSPLP